MADPVDTPEGIRALLLEGRSSISLSPALATTGVRETAVVHVGKVRSLMLCSPLEGTTAEKRANVLRQLADLLDPLPLEGPMTVLSYPANKICHCGAEAIVGWGSPPEMLCQADFEKKLKEVKNTISAATAAAERRFN